MIVLYVLSYFIQNKQNNFAALTLSQCIYRCHTIDSWAVNDIIVQIVTKATDLAQMMLVAWVSN